jgi:hypothetical protein
MNPLSRGQPASQLASPVNPAARKEKKGKGRKGKDLFSNHHRNIDHHGGYKQPNHPPKKGVGFYTTGSLF